MGHPIRTYGTQEIEMMSQACSISAGRLYGLQRVCRVWNVARSMVYDQRQRRRTDGPVVARRGPQGPCSDEQLVEHIRTVILQSPFHGEGYRKIWAKLRFAGIRTSKERTRRLMREHGLQAPQRVGRRHGPKAPEYGATGSPFEIAHACSSTSTDHPPERDTKSWPPLDSLLRRQ